MAIALNADILGKTCVYLLHGFMMHRPTPASLGMFVERLGFAKDKSLVFRAGAQHCADVGYITDFEGRFIVTDKGKQFVKQYAIHWGPEFGWSDAYNNLRLRREILAHEDTMHTDPVVLTFPSVEE